MKQSLYYKAALRRQNLSIDCLVIFQLSTINLHCNCLDVSQRRSHYPCVWATFIFTLSLMFPLWFGVTPQTSGSSSFHFYSVVSAIFNPDRWWNWSIHVISFDLYSQCCFLFEFYWNPLKDKAKGIQCQITIAADDDDFEAGLLSSFTVVVFLVQLFSLCLSDDGICSRCLLMFLLDQKHLR